MKKTILVIIIICMFFSIKNVKNAYAEEENYVKVIYTTIYVYSTYDSSLENSICELEYGAKLKLQNQLKTTGTDGFLYYSVEIYLLGEKTQGYVLCSQVVDVQLSSPIKDLDFNATLNQDADIYILNLEEYTKTNVKISAGQPIKILDGYNPNEKYTRIQYKESNGDIVTAYIPTDTIKVSGISRTTIGAIIIIVATVSLVLVLFGVKGKKKKS